MMLSRTRTRFRPGFATTAALVASAALLLAPGLASAQDPPAPAPGAADLVPDDVNPLEEPKIPVGWNKMLKASGNLALSHNKNVVGNPDGTNLTLGFLINGGFGYLNETREHEWENYLDWQLSYTRTPAFDLFIKNMDALDFQTAYLYHIPAVPWFGPFAAFRLKAQVFPGYTVLPAETTVTRLDPQGEREPRTDLAGNPIGDQVYESGKKIPLTDAFAPTSLRETVGLFAIPYEERFAKLDIRAGFGAWEVFVRDGYTIADDAATAALEIQRMQDSVQLGPEVSVKITGLIADNVNYGLYATWMYPVYVSIDTDLEGVDLMNSEYAFLLGVKLWEFASLDYSFKAYELPLIANQWQIQNSLLLSITLQVI
jgi:hypothetical protein